MTYCLVVEWLGVRELGRHREGDDGGEKAKRQGGGMVEAEALLSRMT